MTSRQADISFIRGVEEADTLMIVTVPLFKGAPYAVYGN